MYNKDHKESGYAFFDVETKDAESFVTKPHLIKNALINCKIAADNTRISQVQKNEMERKLYVSNLPPGTTDLDLLTLFAPFGKLSKAYLVRNRTDGSCKNFGFVIYQDKIDVEKVLHASPSLKFKQRKITIKKAVDRQTQKSIKKTSLVKPYIGMDHQHRPEGHQASGFQQMLTRTSMLNQDSNNYRFNHPIKVPRADFTAHRVESEPGTSNSITLQAPLTSLECKFFIGQ